MPPHVLYFHGFASSPASAKIAALRPLLAGEVILDTPDLNVPSFAKLDYEAMIAHAVDAGRRNPPQTIVGSSLGAIVALEVVRRGVLAPLVLIAPALGVADRWTSKLPPGDPIMAFNHTLGTQAPIHRAFFDQICQVRVDADPPPTRVTVIMGRNDETVPFASVFGTWQSWQASGGLVEGSKFVEIPAGDHSLVAETERIAEEIRSGLRRP